MPSVSSFLIDRLKSNNIQHVFGVPGDYVLDFYSQLYHDQDVSLINTTDENHAGFAADGYARANGAGAICVTYNVGALKVANAVACGYAERSPMMVIVGAPGINERKQNMLLHHVTGSFDNLKNIFSNITCFSEVISDPSEAGLIIDNAFEAMHYHKQPVYLELPRDIAKKPIRYDVYQQGTPDTEKSHQNIVKEAVQDIFSCMEQATHPVCILGVEAARYGYGKSFQEFCSRHNIPFATTLLSKSIIGEDDPNYLGVYQGGASRPHILECLHDSDCVLLFGVMLSDFTLLFRDDALPKNKTLLCNVGTCQVKNHLYPNLHFQDICKAFLENRQFTKTYHRRYVNKPLEANFIEASRTHCQIDYLRQEVQKYLNEDTVVVADVGDSLFLSSDFSVSHAERFFCPAFYLSMGFAIPAALGLKFAKPNLRPVVLLGDGSFQMSVSELSSFVRYNLNPVIIILNNDGYSTERFLKEGEFNDIHRWAYHKQLDVYGCKNSFLVQNDIELEKALEEAFSSDSVSLLNVQIDRKEVSAGLKRITAALGQKV